MREQLAYTLAVVLIGSFLLGGCGDPNKRRYHYSFEQRFITITTEPSNATVTLVQPFGQPPALLGKTPLNSVAVAVMTRLKSVKNIRFTPQAYATYLNNAVVRIEHEGYESFYGPLRTEANETVEHHIELQPLPNKQ